MIPTPGTVSAEEAPQINSPGGEWSMRGFGPFTGLQRRVLMRSRGSNFACEVSMSKRLALYLFVAANIALGLTYTAASPAQADERPCVSRMEYRDIRSAWPPAHRGKVDRR